MKYQVHLTKGNSRVSIINYQISSLENKTSNPNSPIK